MGEFKVDVIVPVFNVEQYIVESIKSICNQKFDNYRVILVNDGTKDNSISLAVKILETYNTPYIIITQNNQGLPSARNSGMRNSDSKYVVFVDSDDIVTNTFISDLFNACVDNHVMAAFSEYEVTHINDRMGINTARYGVSILKRDELLYANMLRNIKIHLCAVMFNRQFLFDNNLWFDESLRFGEEVDYTWRLYPLLNEIAYVKAKHYKYLVRENSLMTNQSIDRVIILLNTVHKNFERWFNECPVDKDKYRWAEQKIYFEKIHAFAQQAQYRTFIELLNKTDYKIRIVLLRDFPVIKIRILSFLLYKCPYAFWLLFQLHKL